MACVDDFYPRFLLCFFLLVMKNKVSQERYTPSVFNAVFTVYILLVYRPFHK